jgi:hydroxymethylpyrimidine pyrophosphatase-like HAD family hydrolase
MTYRMLGLDIDGTLLNRAGDLSVQNIDAVARAIDAGMLVVPCTGRAWRESRMILAQLPAIEVGVFVGGAAVSRISDGVTVDLAAIEPTLALQLVEHLADFPEAVLVYQDLARAGCDYLIAGRGRLTDNTRWWFDVTEAVVRECREPTLDDLHHTMRVGLVAPGVRIGPVEATLAEQFLGRVLVHSFEAVQTPDPMENVHVLEVFAAGVDKWRGLQWVAQQHEIATDEIVVIGDEINDIAMIRAAGCGIAMGNAIDLIKREADHVTLTCEQSGVAHAIDQLLSGKW